MEKILKEILAKIDKLEGGQGLIQSTLKEYSQKLDILETEVKGIKEEHGRKLDILETEVKGIKEEHGRMLRAIIED